jgi:GNAT superfamily N-acetyltransferase
MSVRIRAVSAEDLKPISSLVERANATYREWAEVNWQAPGEAHERLHWQALVHDPRAWNAVAVSDNELLGCASFHDAHGSSGRAEIGIGLAELSRLFVAPEHWRRGIGKQLLRRAVEEMRRRNYQNAHLFTPADNSRARSFYEQQGWQLCNGTRRWQSLLLVRYGKSLF